MTTWNPRYLPYPLLAPWNDDYGDSAFGASMPHDAVLSSNGEISFTIKYNLTSPYLRQLIAEGKANYVALITCSKTSSRNAYPTNQDEDVHVLDANDYAEEFRLRPYVVAIKPINGFTSDEHAEEFKQFKPDGFDIVPASILAVGEESRITLKEGDNPYSIIDLVSNPKIENGVFDMNWDEQRIKIQVSPNDKKQIEAIRKKGNADAEMATLFPAIYLHAITEALRKLSEYPDLGWASSIRQSLEKLDITADDEELKNNALKYAQQLLENPVGKLLTAFANKEEE